MCVYMCVQHHAQQYTHRRVTYTQKQDTSPHSRALIITNSARLCVDREERKRKRKREWEWESERERQREREVLLCEHNGNCIVEDALSEHQHVEHRVHVEGVEDGDGGHRVHCGDERPKGKATGKETNRGPASAHNMLMMNKTVG